MAGTGLYAAKKSVASSADTMNGNPSGQVITLTTGGLGGASAYAGGYVTNTTRSESRSIVSHTDTTVTLEGSLAAWLDTDAVTVYDSWSTIAGAEGALWTDQGSTSFSAEQEINIGAGTWIETITVNSALVANARYGLVYDGNNRAASIDANGTLASHISLGENYTMIRGLVFTGTCTGSNILTHSATHINNTFENCLIDGDSSNHYFGDSGSECQYIDVEVDGSNGLSYFGFTFFTAHSFTRCKFNNLTWVLRNWNNDAIFRSCRFDSILYPLTSTAGNVKGDIEYTGCTFYNVQRAINNGSSSCRNLIMRNNIFDNIDYIIYENATTEDFANGIIDIDQNVYNNINNAWVRSLGGGHITTFTAWQALGYDVNGHERDPKLTDPANGDFTLASDSPERHARPSVGSVLDVDSSARNTYRVSTGAQDIGDPAATWSGGSNIALTDLGDGGTLRATWDAADTNNSTLDFEYVIKNNDTGDELAVVDDSTTTYDLASNTVDVEKTVAVGTRFKQVTQTATYDAATDSATPTLTVTIPPAPSISKLVDGDTEDSFIATISADNALDNIYLRYRVFDTEAWTQHPTKRTGSGTLTVTGLESDTEYQVCALATRGAGASVNPSEWSTPVRVIVRSAAVAPVMDVLYSLLIANSEVTDIVGDRIFISSAYQTAQLPYITMEKITDNPVHHLSGRTALSEARIQISAITTTVDSNDGAVMLDTLSDKIRLAIDMYQGNVAGQTGTTWVDSIREESENDDYVNPEDGEESGIFKRDIDFKVWYQRAIV